MPFGAESEQTMIPIPDPCAGCGQCCTTQESPPMYVGYLPGGACAGDNDPDGTRFRALPKKLQRELLTYILRAVAGKRPFHPTYPACLWYDGATKRCRHYDERPYICREFMPGSEGCNRWRTAAGLTAITIGGLPCE